MDEIEKIRQIVAARLAPLGHKVKAIVNYDNFVILPELLDPYSDMVRGLMADFYSHVTRYTTSGFLRMKLGKALQKRGVAPHIYNRRPRRRRRRRSSMPPNIRKGFNASLCRRLAS